MGRDEGDDVVSVGQLGEAVGVAPRRVAVGLLSAVLDHRRTLDALLEVDASGTSLGRLEDRDRRFVRAVVSTALRHHGTIATIVSKLIARPPRKAGEFTRIVEIAAAQILFMDIADHAAVSIAVDLIGQDRDARRYKALANAVLRRMTREREALLADVDIPRCDTPDWLWQRWADAYGEDTTRRVAEAQAGEPALDISVRDDPAVWAERLGGIVLPTGSVRIADAGSVPALAGFDDGAWWVQDAAAALPAMVLGDVAGKRVADLCAAPGGKTAALAARGAAVTSVDVSAERLKRLAANLKRLDLSADVVAADILDWEPADAFDAVLLDAPCSATGTIRRHPDVAWLKRPEDVAGLAAKQARMIERAAGWLKPGGTLVYCACSLEPEEGEAHMAAMTDRLALKLLPVDPAEIGGLSEVVTPSGAIRTLPCHLQNPNSRLSGLDGFFIARLQAA